MKTDQQNSYRGLEGNIIELNEIKYLSSEIRLNILKILNERRATISELSKSLDISKSTVVYHLLRLSEIGLVKRVENGERKWIYYELSSKGKSVIQTRKITLSLLLSSSVLSLIAGILQVERYIADVRKLRIVKGVLMPNETVLYTGIIFILAHPPELSDSMRSYQSSPSFSNRARKSR